MDLNQPVQNVQHPIEQQSTGSQKKFWTYIGIGMAIVSFLTAIGIIGFILSKKSQTSQNTSLAPTPTAAPNISISTIEQQEIDLWIRANGLNQYGDSKDTMYPGGTPLFNESTGQRTDRYQYIVEKHPNKPWQVVSVTSPTPRVVGSGEHCGGNIANASVCQPGYHCAPKPGQTIPVGDVGGVCVAN